jgi:hypothetical protein
MSVDAQQRPAAPTVPLRSSLVTAHIVAPIADHEVSTIRTRRWRLETGFPFHQRGRRVLYDPFEVAQWREARTRRVIGHEVHG